MGLSNPLQISVGNQQLAVYLADDNNDFVILCPVVAENSGALEALYALYYLPQNFKLILCSVGIKCNETFDHIREMMKTDVLKHRVILKEVQPGMQEEASSLCSAKVVVYGSSDPMYTKDAPQVIIVFDIASKIMSRNGQHNFAVASSNPDSVASAILRVARNQR